jgi:hypothetical protein
MGGTCSTHVGNENRGPQLSYLCSGILVIMTEA